MSAPIVCVVCQNPGVSEYTVSSVDNGIPEMTVLLCLIHSDTIRLITQRADPEHAWRFANPGRNPLTRAHVTAWDEVAPLDWMPVMGEPA